MGCNCGGQQKVPVKYVYTSPKGQQTTFMTEIEAKAAQIRAGGGGSIRIEPK